MKTKLILIGIIITLCGALYVMYRANRAIRRDLQRVEQNLLATTREYTGRNGNLVSQVQALEVELRDLRSAKTSESNEYTRKLARAMETIDNLKLKLKNVESVSNIEVTTTGIDTVYISHDTIPNISPIDDGYLKAVFKPIEALSYQVDYTYSDSIDIVISRARSSHDRRFFLCRVLRPWWIHTSTVTASNPNSRITVNDLIVIK